MALAEVELPVWPDRTTVHVLKREEEISIHPEILTNLRGQNIEYLQGLRKGEAIGLFVLFDGALAHWAFVLKGSRTTCLLGVGQGQMLLGNAYTKPDFRGRGLQTLSLRQRLYECRRLGAVEAFTETEPDNLPSRRAMERVGMALVREITLMVVLTRVVFRRTRSGKKAPLFGLC